MTTLTGSYTTTPRTRTDVVCSKCSKATTVPFVPTPGRPVFCRECFAKSGSAPRPYDARSTTPRAVEPVPGQRKRMMAQGRKTHFIYDARAALASVEGGMDAKDERAFLEGLFARGARGSTEDAQVFLEQKVNEGVVKHEQALVLGKLIDKYSFVR